MRDIIRNDITDYNTVIEKSDFFRNIQIWPVKNVLNYKGWLDNFSIQEEKEIASHVLDFFMFFSKQMIFQMLKTVVGYCGEYLKSRFPYWQHVDFLKKCIFSYIPGESISPTDSGHIFLRYLRDELHIPEENLLEFNKLLAFINKSSDSIPVIFIDDFVGSGAQCVKAWNKNKIGLCGETLSKIASKSSHTFIYAPLIANHIGYEYIKHNCIGLKLYTCYLLGNEYNLFDPDCLCWKNNKDLYLKGTELIISKSKELKIPDSAGKNVIDLKGFNQQGLALAFEHGAPDAIPAIFYWCNNWTPLIKKEYKR
jgi:hypothetical protein